MLIKRNMVHSEKNNQNKRKQTNYKSLLHEGLKPEKLVFMLLVNTRTLGPPHPHQARFSSLRIHWRSRIRASPGPPYSVPAGFSVGLRVPPQVGGGAAVAAWVPGLRFFICILGGGQSLPGAQWLRYHLGRLQSFLGTRSNCLWIS